jgi:excisionase family DNA binding protein
MIGSTPPDAGAAAFATADAAPFESPSSARNRRTYTIDQVAALIGCSRAAAYAAASRGELPILRIGRRLFVPRAAFDQMLSDPACLGHAPLALPAAPSARVDAAK